MKIKKQLAVALSTFGVAALALGGSTFAWFQVANTANLGLGGTTAAVGDNLQVGFRFSEAAYGTTGFVDDATAVGLVQNTIDLDASGSVEELDIDVDPLLRSNLINAAAMAAEDNVFWAPNNITSEVMEFVTSIEGFVNNDIHPVTSGSFNGAGDVALKATPVYNANRTNRIVEIDTPAERNTYVGFQMVFRVASPKDDISQGELGDAVADYGVYFDQGTSVKAVNANVEQAFRISVKNRNTNTSKIIGIEKTLPGNTLVGGRMDLNGDGVWDFTAGIPTVEETSELDSEGSEIISEVIAFNKYEIAYGEFERALVESSDWDEEVAGGSAIAVPFSNQDFLNGASHKEVFPFLTDNDLDDGFLVSPATAAFDAIRNNTYGATKIDDAGSELSGIPTPVADPLGVTNANGILELQMQFWLEGWDDNTVNDVAGTAFGLYLSFISVK